MQFCWKMLPSWEQGWLSSPLSLIRPGQGAGGSWGLPLRSRQQHCTQKHLALLDQTTAFWSFAFNSAVCAPHCIYYSVLSVFSLPQVPAIKKLLIPLLTLRLGSEHPFGVRGTSILPWGQWLLKNMPDVPRSHLKSPPDP